MINTGKLAGKTVFITGASRGIGKSIALKLAKDGANIIIAAKTTEPHPKLPGTIFSACEEVKAAGGQCLPCTVDIRDEAQVQKAVDEAVHKFGGIDILINNASAISLTGTQETPMKRYDLMMGVNVRGTYLVSQKCIPYLKQAKNPHILNLSPPLNMKPMWFQNHVAYTMSKYGMSMCVLGMADELKPDKIAVNALWPRTAIWTAAMAMIGGGEGISKQCRKPDIVADAAYVILTRDSRNCTGNFFIDEEVLKQEGVQSFDKYAVQPGHPLMPDFFLDSVDPATLEKMLEAGGDTPKFRLGKGDDESPRESKKASSGGPSGANIQAIFGKLSGLINSDLIQKIQAVYKFEVAGAEPGIWFIDLKSPKGGCGSGEPADGKADVTMQCNSEDFVKMFTGNLKPTAAFMTGKLKIRGDMGKALKLEKLMGEMKSKL